MRRTFAHPRLALILRRWRGRFGISAPRVAVRTHLPWYWRALAAVVVLGFSLALAGWIYEAGRRFSGFDRSEADQELTGLREKSASLEQEVVRLRALADAGESKLQIELTTQQQLTRQAKALEEENSRLKEDLSVFENLAQAEGPEGSLSINRLRVETDMVDQYRYRMLVAIQGGKKDREFNGSLQLAMTLQQDGKNVMMVLPAAEGAAARSFDLRFKHFRRIEGTFKIPVGARLKSVEVRLLQDGVVKAAKTAII